MKQKLLSFLIFWFYINGRPKTRLGYIVQPLLAITIGVIVIVTLNSLFFCVYINGPLKTRLGYIVQPLLPIIIWAIVIVILNSLFPSCGTMLKTKNESLRISENKKALKVEADMKRANCPN